ncbi:MAG TPA: Hpt domain-containing protein, partial [Candidatus Berkiella sp.]|nr:Hpt domain-containing protein [Candidatus Berkiella sp.]
PAQNSVNQTFTQKDFKAMREAVHRLHGACCYCGVSPLKTAVVHLETAISKNENDKVNFLLVEFNKEVNRLLQYYKLHAEYHVAHETAS